MGVPSPGETALVLAGVLASQGKLSIVLVIAIASASAIVGDNVGYLLGRMLGREVLEKPGPFQKHRIKVIAAGHRFFEKYGSRAVFLGRWVALVRVSAAWMAGITEMRFRTFFIWNALGGITWATTFGLVAYFAGDTATKVISKVGLFGAIGLAVLVVGGVIWLKVRERRAET
jgi:membrane protein DedA with SNARE-associated domain